MAQKRMLDKKISINEMVADMSIPAQLLFTWMIPHADDLGLLPYSARTIKAMVIPMTKISVESIGFHLETMLKVGLLEVFEHGENKYYHVAKFAENQTLKKDRNPQTLLDVKMGKEVSENWKKCEDLLSGIQLEDIGNHLDTEVNRREVNRTEKNVREESTREERISVEDDGVNKNIPF